MKLVNYILYTGSSKPTISDKDGLGCDPLPVPCLTSSNRRKAKTSFRMPGCAKSQCLQLCIPTNSHVCPGLVDNGLHLDIFTLIDNPGWNSADNLSDPEWGPVPRGSFFSVIQCRLDPDIQAWAILPWQEIYQTIPGEMTEERILLVPM